MNSLNKTMLIGNLGNDIQMHFFDNEDCIGRVPMATNESYKNKQGEKVTQTEWHNLVFRNQQAKTIEQYCKKGDRLYVEGKLKTRKWTDNNNVDRYSTELHVYSFLFLSNNNESDSKPQKEYNKAGDEFINGGQNDDDFDDLPF